MSEVAYWQHDASGELYAVDLEGDIIIGVCGPLYWEEVTAANREARSFNFDTDPEEIEWASGAAFHAVTNRLPGDAP